MATVNNLTSNAPTTTSNVHRVTEVLHWTYALVPIAAGADKFMHLLTNWDKYLAPIVTRVTQLPAHTFMSIVGVIEISAGIVAMVKPKIGSLIVGCWLIGIVINLLLTGQYFDIAVRDLVMAIGAFCLYSLLDAERND